MKSSHLSHFLILSQCILQSNASETHSRPVGADSGLVASLTSSTMAFILLGLHPVATRLPGRADFIFPPPQLPHGKQHTKGFLLLASPSLNLINPYCIQDQGSPCSSVGKGSACNAGGLGQEDPLEKEMATHSSVLTWRIPWMEGPGGP